MARKRYSDEDILKLLREIELKLSADDDVASVCRYQRRDLLQLAEAVRRDGAVDAIGDAEPGEDRGRARTGQADPQGKLELPKAQDLTARELPQAVVHTRQKLATSERRTCPARITPALLISVR